MTDARGPFIERILSRTARAVGGGLHPLEILGAVEDACRAKTRDGHVPNHVTVSFHAADLARYRPALADLEAGVRDTVASLGGKGTPLVVFERASGIEEGSVGVAARFADTSHRPAAVPPGATRRIQRHDGVWLSVNDGTKVRLTHTPFTIGRATRNDLVLVNMAISRYHVRITHSSEGFVAEDLGSRNGLEVLGARLDRVILRPGIPVKMGDVEFSLEEHE